MTAASIATDDQAGQRDTGRGLAGAASARTALDRGGVQLTLRKVVDACGLKKTSPPTAFATAMRPI